jgi:hypothetical protein
MIKSSTSLILSACLALAFAGQLSVNAQEPGRAPGARGFGMRGPGFDSLSQEEKDKVKAASEKAMQDSKVKAAREKMEAVSKEFRDAMRAAQLAADPTVEPILKKLDEAREKAMAERGAGRPQPAK